MRVGLLVVALLVGLAAVELVARAREAFDCPDRPGSVMTRDPFFGWGNRAGAFEAMQGCCAGRLEWRPLVVINSRGLHDREIPFERTAARRLLVLGDSFTEAFQVAVDASFAKRLERALDQPDPPGTQLEVVTLVTQFLRRRGIPVILLLSARRPGVADPLYLEGYRRGSSRLYTVAERRPLTARDSTAHVAG